MRTTTTPPRPGRPRRARVHAPAGLDPGTAVPLVCMLHGCTQDAASFAAATRMDDGRRPPRLHRRLPAPGAGRERPGLLELVRARAPGARARRAGGDRRDPARADRHDAPWTVDRRARLRGRPLRRRRDGRDPRRRLSGPRRRRRRALGARLRVGDDRRRRLQGDGPRRGGPDACGRAAHAAMGDLARPVPSLVVHGNADPTVAPVNGDQVLAPVDDREPPRRAGTLRPRHRRADRRPARATSTAATRSRARAGRPATARRCTRCCTFDGLGHAWSGGLPGRLLHRPAGTRRHRGDLELLRRGRRTTLTRRAAAAKMPPQPTGEGFGWVRSCGCCWSSQGSRWGSRPQQRWPPQAWARRPS